jgi:CubicO group peptidase (beta-lactamase class C family)
LLLLLLATPIALAVPETPAPYFPPTDSWQKLPPADLGFDHAALDAAISWAQSQETDMPRDFSTQSQIFGRPLGPLPSSRAPTNGLLLRHGIIAAEWGDTSAPDPTYSVAKSYLSTILGLTLDRSLIPDIHDPVSNLIHDGGYDSPHNAAITWEHHATQTSEWEGELFGKSHTFIGREEFGRGERKPRDLLPPGDFYEYNDVRINRFSLSLLRLWRRPLPQVLKLEIMDPIGASNTWTWHPYSNSTIDIDGIPMPSVSGGTRWGAGLWMNSRDHARFGLLILNKGRWNDRQLLSESWIREATSQHGQNPGYGYLWWLNTKENPQRNNNSPANPTNPTPTAPTPDPAANLRWPGASPSSFAAIGAGNNTIWIDPEHDLVLVWRWHADALPEFLKRLTASLKN